MREELSGCSDLTLHLYCSRYPALRSLCLPPEALLTGGKSAMLARLLPPMLAEGHRVLIFSQWTSTLDTLGLLLEHLDISCVRFDGSTAAPERQRLIDAFNEDATIGVFLLTTRAGGLGINLTAADTVIIHDVDFNPAADKQAMDRAHRMGQQRPVRVIKLASAKTVDEQVLKIAKIFLIHGQGITQDRRRILYGVSLGECGPDRWCPGQAHHDQQADQPCSKPLKSQPNRQGEPQVLKGLWHSRMIP